MRGGFQRLVNPATRLGDVDLEATRDERRRLHEQVRLRQHLLALLASAPIDEELVQVTPYALIDEEPGAEVAAQS